MFCVDLPKRWRSQSRNPGSPATGAALRATPFLGMTILSVALLCPWMSCNAAQPLSKPCSGYSDSFDSYHPDRWQEVLLYSKAQGTVGVQRGKLVLETPKDEPCEIQVYSLFSLDGDFDVQASYAFAESVDLPACRFNAGFVLQTLGDEKSFKCYVAAAQKGTLFYRARADAQGERNLEIFKGAPAPQSGLIRVVRKEGTLSFLALGAEGWRTLYTFTETCDERLRFRFKLQTSGDEEGLEPCPVVVEFDEFTVNSCQRIVEE